MLVHRIVISEGTCLAVLLGSRGHPLTHCAVGAIDYSGLQEDQEGEHVILLPLLCIDCKLKAEICTALRLIKCDTRIVMFNRDKECTNWV